MCSRGYTNRPYRIVQLLYVVIKGSTIGKELMLKGKVCLQLNSFQLFKKMDAFHGLISARYLIMFINLSL